jgi:hypothetical protein
MLADDKALGSGGEGVLVLWRKCEEVKRFIG